MTDEVEAEDLEAENQHDADENQPVNTEQEDQIEAGNDPNPVTETQSIVRRSSRVSTKPTRFNDFIMGSKFLGIDARPNTFSYAELRTATDYFSAANKLGEGSFGSVYKGTLDDGRVIAVKQLIATLHGKGQFMTEIEVISAVQHRNIVKLYGCCIQGEKRLLVYEYVENKSLDQALFGKIKLSLSWSTRFEICLGVAHGLTNLHEESRIRVVHRDVKASNVLLDSELNPKIADFGLAKLFDDKQTHMSTRIAGTIGYLAPEYAMRGHLTEKADVFGFGVVALEIISGRRNSDSSLDDDKVYLLEWAWNLHEANNELELVDEELSEFNENEVRRMMRVALLCTQTSPMQRPSMSRVIAMLSGDIEPTGVITRPEYLTDFDFTDITSFQSAHTTSGTDSSAPSTSTSHTVATPTDAASRLILHDIIGEEFLGIDARPNTFSYAELRTATDDFSAANKLGEGGFGPVYKGTLDDGRVIAVKQLSIASRQGKSQFMAEIATISAVQHRNLVKLFGCCIDGEKRLLVYEHLENKSLDQALFGKSKLSLSWSTRFEICLGVAHGLTYLHEESSIRVVHYCNDQHYRLQSGLPGWFRLRLVLH
ncbi:leucine-rich repeat transmembrane protein kinase [Artemisia annua]|uniref:Leucine-rich repeat transmembrane protein kinase n=1 Tax=Artemisia annua TaxID=35608 RepID=A0A2U1QES5_ARTAN|nr:leucine-rich repeat transmembrane protein kinase [Artemisia annua]